MKSRQVCVVMGDFNAKLGLGRNFESCVGDYGLGQRNERGDMLAEFCRINGLVVCNTAFQHNLRSRYTWISPDGHTRNQIDYVMISKSWFSSVLDSRARPGAECDTDHHLVTLKLRTKHFRRVRCKSMAVQPFDVARLRNPDVSQKYSVATKNRFSLLRDRYNEECTSNELWDQIQAGIADYCQTNLVPHHT